MPNLLLFGQSQTGPSLTVEASPSTVGAGSAVTLTAELLDENGAAVVGATIFFAVSGANTANGSDTTDASGLATFEYTPTVTGTDTAIARWGTAAGLHLLTSDDSAGKVRRHDGFSTSVLQEYTITTPEGLEFDGENLLVVTTTSMVRYVGLSGTVDVTFGPTVGGVPLVGIAWDGSNAILATETTIHWMHGFTTTERSNFAVPYGTCAGVEWDGENLLIAGETGGTAKVHKMLGVSSTSTGNVTLPDDACTGIAWDGLKMYSIHQPGASGTSKIYRYNGFTGTSEADIAAPSNTCTGVDWTIGLHATTTVTVQALGSTVFGRVSGRVIP